MTDHFLWRSPPGNVHMRMFTDDDLKASPSRADWYARATRAGRRGPLLLGWGFLVILIGAQGCSHASSASALLTSDPDSSDASLLTLCFSLLGVMLTGAMVVAPYTLVMRPVRPRRTILWLRRFHMTGRKWFPFEQAINRGRSFVVAPMTIRDPRMASDGSAGSPVPAALRLLRYVLFAPLGVVLAAGAAALVSAMLPLPDEQKLISVSMSSSGGENAPVEIGVIMAILGLMVLVFAGVSILVWSFLRRLEQRFGYVTLPAKEGAAVRKLDRFFDDVRAGRHGAGRLRIFRTRDESWQAVVGRSIDRADLVLLDVSQLTENILWEVEQVFHRREPEAIIVAIQQSEATGAVDPAVLARLEMIAGADRFSRVQLLEYPARRKTDIGQSVRTVSDTLRDRIFDALDRSQAAAKPG